MASLEDRIAQLTAGMLKKKLYVAISKQNCTPEQLKALLPRHLEYMIALEKQGLLFASGPLLTDGVARGDGLTILRAGSLEQAQAISSADPFVAEGLRTAEVREWTVMEGTFGLKFNFSDGSVEFA